MTTFAPRAHKCERSKEASHSPLRGEPAGYTDWHEWAERKAKTHDQKLCTTCGTYAIWEKRDA